MRGCGRRIGAPIRPPRRSVRCTTRDPAAGLRAAWLTGALIGLDCRAPGSTWPARRCSTSAIRAPTTSSATASFGPGSGRGGGARAGAGRGAAGGRACSRWQSTSPAMGGHVADSHLELPVVSATPTSIATWCHFARNADVGWAMTAHILYTAWDAVRPATLSPAVIGGVIRARGRIGFPGVLVSDDLAMRALSGRCRRSGAAGAGGGLRPRAALHRRGRRDRRAAGGVSGRAATGSPRPRCRRAGPVGAGRGRENLDGAILGDERDRLLA